MLPTVEGIGGTLIIVEPRQRGTAIVTRYTATGKGKTVLSSS